MPKMGLTIGICQALQEVWANYPMWIKERGRIIFIDGKPLLNITSRTCDNYDAESGICKVNCKCRTSDHSITDKELTLLTKRVKDNVWWESRAADEHELVDHSIVLMAEQETIDNNNSLFYGGRTMGRGATGESGSGWSYIQSQLDQSCLRTVKLPVRIAGNIVGYKTRYFSCPFHSSYTKVRARIALGGSSLEIAHDIIGFFIRPDYRLKEPFNKGFSWEEFTHAKDFIALRADRLSKRRWNPLTPKVAWGVARGAFNREHPEYEQLKETVDGIKLNNTILKSLREEALVAVESAGVEVDESEALDVYRDSFINVPIAGGYIHQYIGSNCPITTSAPDGYYPVKIVRHLAVTNQLKEVMPDNEKAVVKLADGSYELASEFNSWELGFRKEALGCDCKDCIQERIWSLRRDERGLRFFTFNVENIINLDERLASELSSLQEASKNSTPMSSVEIEDFDVARRCIAYDVVESPDWCDIKDEVFESMEEEEDISLVDGYSSLSGGGGGLSSRIDEPSKGINMVETKDNLEDYLKIMKKSGPVKVYKMEKEEIDKLLAPKEGARSLVKLPKTPAIKAERKCGIEDPVLHEKLISRYNLFMKDFEERINRGRSGEEESNRFLYHTAETPPKKIPDGWSIRTFRYFKYDEYLKVLATGK